MLILFVLWRVQSTQDMRFTLHDLLHAGGQPMPDRGGYLDGTTMPYPWPWRRFSLAAALATDVNPAPAPDESNFYTSLYYAYAGEQGIA